MPISACASIVQVPNSEPAIVRAGILAEFAMESPTLLCDKKERRGPGITANLIGDSSVIRPVVVINMGE